MSSVTINTKTKRSDLSMVVSRWCLGVATCLAVQGFAATGNAQTFFWANAGGGFWHSGPNWAGGSPPGPGGIAIFGLPNTYNVLWNNSVGDSVNAQMSVSAGNVTFSNTSASTRTYSLSGLSEITGSGTTLTVGSFLGNTMQLTSGDWLVNDGGQLVATAGSRISTPDTLLIGFDGPGTLTAQAGALLTSAFGQIAGGIGGTGTATVTGSGSRWNNSNGLWVGQYGNGALNISAGGAVDCGVLLVGGDTGITSNPVGAVTVTGSGSQLTFSFVGVGESGQGTLLVAAGGFVNSSNNSFIGYYPNSTGAVTVTGSGSHWNNESSFGVGRFGTGTLNIEAGGLVTSYYGNLATEAGSTGTATVTGSGSRWESTQQLTVGYRGTGTLNVQNGGVVANTLGMLGNEGSASGFMTVTGSGSRWMNSFHVIVGNSGFATLDIVSGGEVTNTNANIGLNVGSGGLVTVSGAGSKWTNSEYLIVGSSGQGTLNVLAGGAVTNTDAVIGFVSGSVGTALVSGANSKWTNSGFLNVGNSGTGTLNVQNGGVVANTAGVVGPLSGSTGTVTVTGSGSQWNNTAHLFVGSFGNGTLNIAAGGVVNNTVGSVAQENGSVSTATVTGIGSQWNNSNILVVGNNAATGTLNVTAGGVVTNTHGYIANEGPSTGVVTVNGIGSRWINSNNLYVGHKGAGTLNVQNGGVVTNAGWGYLGLEPGSTGTATVTGPGSQWNNSSELNVGTSGNGTLRVEAGGLVTTAHGLIGRFAGSSGIATVTGAGSQLNSAPYLFVGHEGTGTLNVTAGGVVTAEHGALGTVGGSSGTVTVNGSGSQWINTGSLIVGHASAGTLNVENGGVVANPQGAVGNLAGSSGTVTVTGSGSQWNNSVDLQVGVSGNGILNIANGGSVNVGNLTTVGADGQINNSDGSFVSNTVINQAGGEILGRGSFSAVGGWSNSGFMAFRGGVSNVYGAVNNQAGGTIFSEFFGTTYFHGDVVHNGAQIAVGAGSTIQFLGTASGAGNYFSGGTVTMNGAFRPGNGPGVVSFANALSFGAGASLEIEIGGLTAGSQHDKLSIGGDLALAGELEVSLINGFNPSVGQSFNILDWGSLAGTFSSISLPTLAGLAWNTSQLYTTGVLSVVAAGLPGDYNNNGVVDAGDYVIFRKYAGTSQVLPNDPTGGTIGGAQYTTWRNNYGKPPGSGSANGLGGGEVPEPNSLVLLCLAVAGTLARRRSASRRSW